MLPKRMLHSTAAGWSRWGKVDSGRAVVAGEPFLVRATKYKMKPIGRFILPFFLLLFHKEIE